MFLQRDHLEILEWTGAVRRLAQEAYDLTRSNAVDTAKVADLRARIESLRTELREQPHAPVYRWLDNLQAEVAASVPAESRPLLTI